jgi:hypothetical protein
MTNETTTSPVRFTRVSRGAPVLAHPLPSRLEATLTAKQRKEHETLVERVEGAARQIAALREAIDQAPGADRQAGREAALRGEDVPPPSEPKLRAELEEAQRQRQALEAALRQSADGLLQAAAPKAEEVAAELERELGAATEAIRARLADLGDGLAELGELFGQAAWTRALTHATGSSVGPFGRSTREFSETRGKLSVVTQALDFELRGIEERRRDAEAERAQRAKLDVEWAAEHEQLAAKAKEGQRSER